MAISLYMDHHVPLSITNGLRLRDVDILTAYEDGKNKLGDSELLDRANELKRILFTQDDDFLAEAAIRQKKGIPFYGVIYAHQLRISIGGCIRNLELIAKKGQLEDIINQVLFLPL